MYFVVINITCTPVWRPPGSSTVALGQNQLPNTPL